VRSQHAMKKRLLSQMEPLFPFCIRELQPDKDSSLLSDLLLDWCCGQRIRLSRSRPYYKHDNA